MDAGIIVKTVVYDRLCRTVADMVAAAKRCGALLEHPTPPDMDELANVRWALARAILEHLSFKGKYIFDALEKDDDPRVRTKAKVLRESQQALHEGMHKQMTIWSRAAVEADWNGFRKAGLAQHKILADRIALEERELHPMVYRAESRTDASSSHNWARIAWEIRDSVYNG